MSDCEMPAVYDCEKRKARKDHVCYECGGVIKKGEQYNYHHGIWNGEPGDFKICVDCDVLREQVRGEQCVWDCIGFGELGEEIYADVKYIKTYFKNRIRRAATEQNKLEWLRRYHNVLANHFFNN